LATSVTEEKVSGGVILKISGFADGVAGKAIREKATLLMEQGVRKIALDFSEAPLVDSAAIGELIELVSVPLEDDDVAFYIFGLTEVCQKTFLVTGILNCTIECETKEEALKALSR